MRIWNRPEKIKTVFNRRICISNTAVLQAMQLYSEHCRFSEAGGVLKPVCMWAGSSTEPDISTCPPKSCARTFGKIQELTRGCSVVSRLLVSKLTQHNISSGPGNHIPKRTHNHALELCPSRCVIHDSNRPARTALAEMLRCGGANNRPGLRAASRSSGRPISCCYVDVA